jgi:demethylmenaquinone methyltransferase/2-methoxy-6-polyprenyl-1,4-benzoquinol methylase
MQPESPTEAKFPQLLPAFRSGKTLASVGRIHTFRSRMTLDTDMINYYAQRANEYEQIYLKPERQADLALLRESVPREFIDRDVLEIACGTGYWTGIVAPVARSVTALDINEGVLDIARRKPWAGRQVEFIQADIYDAPTFPREFTAGLAAFWWSHVPSQRLRTFLQQFHQRLSSDSRVMFVDNAYVEGSSTPISSRDADGNTFQQRPLRDGSIHNVLKNFPTEAELRETLHGLASDVRVTFLQYYWTLAYTPYRQGQP